MIPVTPQPEPDIFDELVRKKGQKFLSKFTTTKPNYIQWKKQDYWNKARVEFYTAYQGICAYTARWIARSDNPNIDHYQPKSNRPDLAYEWSNYRLSCALVNNYKKEFTDVLDPFKIGQGWFILDFPSLLIKPNSTIPEQISEQVKKTLERLKLNNDTFIEDRSSWLKRYCLGETNFEGLKKVVPFIACELERQGLVDKIKDIMDYSRDIDY